MVRRTTQVLVFVLIAAAGVSAQDITVEYVEGYVEVQQDTNWTEVYIGDVLSSDARVRLDDNSYAELSSGASLLKLTRSGTYVISDLIRTSEQTSSANLGSLLTGRIRKFTSPDENQQTTVGGVRAKKAPGEPDVTWVGGESVQELIDEGIAQLAEENYTEAFGLFQDAYDYATGSDVDRTLYYMGYASYLAGKTADAVHYLDRSAPTPDAAYYSDHALTLAQVLIETFAYPDALDVLSSFIAGASPTGEDLQIAFVLQGLAYRGLGNVGTAREYFRKAVSVNEDSTPGQVAATLLNG